MPWKTIKLKDGDKELPEIAFGSWLIGNGQTVIDQITQAADVGFTHFDTAQVYKNEDEVGDGFKATGLAREKYWVTTKWSAGKWSGTEAKGITQSIHESLDKLKLKSLDLYLIHSPRLTNGDHVTAWQEMLQVKKDGLTTHVGVSNFEIKDLEILRNADLPAPAVNQILLHPYVYKRQAALVEYHAEHGIVTEAYSTLFPLTHETNGPLAKPLKKIAEKHDVTEAAILFAWARKKGAVVITTSRQKVRLEQYLGAGDVELSEDDVSKIDLAGATYESWAKKQKLLKVAGHAVVGLAGLGYWWWRQS